MLHGIQNLALILLVSIVINNNQFELSEETVFSLQYVINNQFELSEDTVFSLQ